MNHGVELVGILVNSPVFWIVLVVFVIKLAYFGKESKTKKNG